MAACSLVMENDYPFWDGVSIDCAVASLDHHYRSVTQIADGKPVLISETGWPSCGNTVGLAVPSPDNAIRYFREFAGWSHDRRVSAFYFDAFDESWKVRDEGPQGACWGLWTKDGRMKPGAESVFRGDLLTPGTWGGVIGGPGEPSLTITYLPDGGSEDDLEGRAAHVDPFDYAVAVYIYVNGWWTKPYWSSPTTIVQCDGRWVCDITTGGDDIQATRVAAFLLPEGYAPPLAEGQATLPNDLASHAIASAQVSRTAAR